MVWYGMGGVMVWVRKKIGCERAVPASDCFRLPRSPPSVPRSAAKSRRSPTRGPAPRRGPALSAAARLPPRRRALRAATGTTHSQVRALDIKSTAAQREGLAWNDSIHSIRCAYLLENDIASGAQRAVCCSVRIARAACPWA